MKLGELKLTLDDDDFCYRIVGRRGDDNELCGGGVLGPLSRVFEIPTFVEDCPRLWLSLHDSPGVYRERVRVVMFWPDAESVRMYGSKPYPRIEIGGVMYEDESLDRFLKRFVGKRVYLEVEYLEGEDG